MSASGRQSVGHPVDVASGVMFNELPDCWLPGMLPLTFQRYYSTGLLTDGTPFTIAPGWRHNFELELKQDLEGYTFTDDKGSQHALPDRQDLLAQTGKLTVPNLGIELRGAGDVIELERYTEAPGTKLLFRRVAGARTLRAEGFSWYPGVRLDFGFDRLGRLSEVAQSRSGRRLRFAYDGGHRLREVTLERPSLLVLGFEYDARGRLVGVADAVGTKSRYEYDDHGRMLSEAKRGGSVYTFRYDVDGRCVYASGTDRFEERRLAYDAKSRTTRVTDSHGHVTRYHYNDAGQVVEKETPLGALSQYAFDDAGRPTQTLEDGIVKSELAYDELGRIASASAPDGRKIELTYDQDHNLVGATDLKGRTWRYRFAHRRLVGSTNPLGQEWAYESNGFGEIVRVTNPLGHSSTFGWDAQGNLQWSGRPSGVAWWYWYDELGRVIEIRDPAGGVEKRTYDTSGALTSVQRPDGRLWRTEFDAAGRPATWILPDGTKIHSRYSGCGQLVEQTDADGNTHRFQWDTEPGRVLAVEDAAGKRVSYTYDPEGRPLVRRNWDGAETKMEYNAVGCLTALTTPGGGRTTFEYDGFVRLAKRTDPDGQMAEFEYDDNGLVTRAKNAAADVTWARDLYGRVLKESAGGADVELEYDAGGRAILARLPFGPDVRTEWTPDDQCAAISIGAYRIGFEYDPIGREVVRHFPGGGSYQQSYDPAGRLLDQSYRAPRSYQLGQIPGTGGIGSDFFRRFEYDANGRMSRLEDSRRGGLTAVHDAVGQLCAVLRDDGSAAFYDLDPANNRAFKAEAPPGAYPRVEDVRQANARSGTRFNQGQMEARRFDIEVSIQRADQGNRITELRRPDRRTFFHHDPEGRLVLKEEQQAQQRPRQWRYEWNGCGTLAAVVTPEAERWEYAYDALGRRISRRGPHGSTRYVWSGQRLLHVLVDGQAPRTRIPNPGLASNVAELRDGDLYYALPDQVRATAEIVDERGNLVWSSDRGPWGETSPESAREGDDGFAGQIYDPESGLYYNFHRYYDPQLGRFISPDPIGLLGGFNEYAYVPSPLGWMDVDGLTATGGPYPYNGRNDNQGRPDLRGEKADGRSIVNTGTDANRNNTVPAPEGDSGGKTLAVLRGPDGSQGAFVSGHGGSQEGQFPASWDTTSGPYGNWCHAEMQAANFLRTAPRGDYQLFIDRPPCEHCDSSLAAALAHLERYGRNVDVYYKETDKKGKARWKKYTGC